jgi:hypothetical protein
MKRATWLQTSVRAGQWHLCALEIVGREMLPSSRHAVRPAGNAYIFGQDPCPLGGAYVSG